MCKMTLAAALAALMIGPAAEASPPGRPEAPGPDVRAAARIAAQETGTLKLSLADCLARALSSNPDLAIEALNPEMDAASLAETREQYLPQFQLTSFYINRDQPSTWGVEGPTVSTKQDYYQFGIGQRLPTGTELSLGLSSSRTDTNRAYTTINPSFQSEMRFRLTQPLLRGFGLKINRYETIKAGRRLEGSEATLKAQIHQTIYDVEVAYWNLYHARESLRVQELSLSQSRETLGRNREAARIGTKSAIDVLSAETEVARWEDTVLNSRLQMERMENRLKVLLGLPIGQKTEGAQAEARPGAAEGPSPAIELLDKPLIERRAVTYEDALRTALARRPELVSYENTIADAALDVSYFKNQLLPQLDLEFSFWNPGQSGIKYLFQDNNPLSGIIVGKIEGSRVDSFKDVFRRAYNNVQLNVTLSIPLAGVFSRASLARARTAQDQARLRMDKERRTIELEVLEAVRDLETSARRLETSARYRELTEKQVEAETQRYQIGLVSSFELFQYQRNLTGARADEIRAAADFRIAVAALEKATGTTLQAKGLKFRDFDF